MTADDSIDAAELALGLIEGEERSAAMRRVLADLAFAAEVERWRDRFATLLVAVPEVTPDAALERRVLRGAAANDGGADAAAPWRRATAAASLIAAVLLGVIVLRPAAVAPLRTEPPVAATVAPRAILAAAMAPTAGTRDLTAFPVTYDVAQGDVRLAGAVTVPADRSAQLWLIAGKDAPRPIGVLAAGATSIVTLSAADRRRIAQGATLAISIEPAGGSPTGAPTGPVVATGVLVTT